MDVLTKSLERRVIPDRKHTKFIDDKPAIADLDPEGGLCTFGVEVHLYWIGWSSFKYAKNVVVVYFQRCDWLGHLMLVSYGFDKRNNITMDDA